MKWMEKVSEDIQPEYTCGDCISYTDKNYCESHKTTLTDWTICSQFEKVK